MPKISSSYICQQCGYKSSQFLGRCPECGEWNSLVETVEDNKIKNGAAKHSAPAAIIELSDVSNVKYERIPTTLSEFDRVLGGGIVLGSVVLISGDPGIGKSTLLTQLALNTEGTLYVAGEESASQIKIRVDRIKKNGRLKVLNETDVDIIALTIEAENPKLVIIDSIQTLETTDLESAPGSVGQVRETAHRLQHLAKRLHIPIFLVGHINKEGSIAGPKTLEHLVDVVLLLEGEPSSNLRMLRSFKNRFGASDEIGIFEMAESGMKEVLNPSALFLEQQVSAPGSVVVPTLNGLRPILVEVQALVTKSYLPVPRRSANGIDINRLQLLTAVIAKRLGLNLYDQDVFVNITGGFKITEPAIDLGVCLAIISSLLDKTLPAKTAVIGEVGLLGEVRAVQALPKRIAEAKKLGFKNIITPVDVKSLSEAMRIIFQVERESSRSKTV